MKLFVKAYIQFYHHVKGKNKEAYFCGNKNKIFDKRLYRGHTFIQKKDVPWSHCNTFVGSYWETFLPTLKKIRGYAKCI